MATYPLVVSDPSDITVGVSIGEFPSGGGSSGGSGIPAYGIITGVVADGTVVTTIAFQTAFTTVPDFVMAFASENNLDATSPCVPNYVAGSLATTGFAVRVTGGPSSSTCSVIFIAGGSSASSIPQNGSVTGVAADGSSLFSVVFPQAYTSEVSNVQLTVNATGTPVNIEVPQVYNVSLTGFEIYVAGGAPSSTVNVYWSSNGT